MISRKTLGKSLAILALLGSLAAAAVILRLRRDLEPEIRDRAGSLVAASIEDERAADGFLVQEIALRSTSGLEVHLALKRRADPADGSPANRRPLAILLGGLDTGRKAIELLPDTGEVAVAALAYPFRGSRDHDGLAWVVEIPAIQDALRDTPAAILLALDWASREPWVDPARIELVGVSLGAPFACVAGAMDARFARVWSLHGAGSPVLLLEHGLRKRIPWMPARKIAARALAILGYGETLAPERWVARVAPRPFVMVNALEDQRIPRPAIERLYEAARDPKEIVWTPGRHVEPDKRKVLDELIGIVLGRMRGRSS
jgi:dienelactone hydrolase